MRLVRIRLSRVFSSLFVILSGLASLLPSRLTAQACTGPLQSSKQTFSVTTTGNTFTPSFNQYNPPAGYVLVSAVIQTNASVAGSASLTNNTSSIQAVGVGVNDYDQIGVGGAYFTNGETGYGNFNPVIVPANGTATAGPATAVPNTQLQYDSVPNSSFELNYFIGSGTADISYLNLIYTQSSNSNVTATFDVLATVNFNLTYYYCYTGTLAANLLTFTATLENPQTVLLNWLTTNETVGEKYVVQVSDGNGSDFRNVDTVLSDAVAGNGNYAYNYMVQPTDKGNLYFRLEILSPTGPNTYSPLRVVDLGSGSASAFSIYPNPPSSFINLTFPGNSRDWQVEIFAADGDLVQQNYFSNTNLATVNFNHKMAAGAYFVRAVNPQTNDHYAGSFLIGN
jgi:Secretion system C-terminal sorting domain